MEFLHTMVRVTDVDESLQFYSYALGLRVMSRHDYPEGRFSLIFLAAPDQFEEAKRTHTPLLELTYNWDHKSGYTEGRNFGHLAFRVDNIYDVCARLQEANVIINRPPRDGQMAFVRSPDNISIELLQKGKPLEPQEPWASMENSGHW